MNSSLSEMFQKQEELENRLGYDFDKMTLKERADFIKEYSLFLQIELAEMLQELPLLKPWKDYSKMTSEDIDAAYKKVEKEYVDITHFFLVLGLAIGFDEEKLYSMYLNKNAANHKRQDNGYDYTQQHLDD